MTDENTKAMTGGGTRLDNTGEAAACIQTLRKLQNLQQLLQFGDTSNIPSSCKCKLY